MPLITVEKIGESEPMPFKKNPWRVIQFPIVRDGADWPRECRKRLGLLDPRLHTRFERLQPFFGRKMNIRSALIH